jgi:hypothetical protein
MPTSNPRITVTLSPATHAQLRRLSELTGNSQSALVSELLEMSAPVFERTIRILEAAQEAKEEMRGAVASDMAKAQERIEAQLGLVLDDFDSTVGAPLLRDLEAVKRRARRKRASGSAAADSTRAAAPSTPLSNRGVRSQGKKTKKPMRTRG